MNCKNNKKCIDCELYYLNCCEIDLEELELEIADKKIDEARGK